MRRVHPDFIEDGRRSFFERRNIFSLPPRNPFTNFTNEFLSPLMTAEGASLYNLRAQINLAEIGVGLIVFQISIPIYNIQNTIYKLFAFAVNNLLSNIPWYIFISIKFHCQ
jgi:hypothetical protein